VTTTTCRDCHRPISDPESQARERGSHCWREHRAALGIAPAKTLGHGRRTWVKDMPGQEELDIEEAAA